MIKTLLRKRRNLSPAARHYQLVVWDFDGTLVDSLSHSVRIFNQLADKHGFKPVLNHEHDRRLPVRQFLKEHGIKLRKLPRLTKEFWAEQHNIIDQMPLSKGVEEILRTLKVNGTELGILSSNHPRNIQKCLTKHGVLELFSFVEGYSKLLGKAHGLKKVLKRKKLKRDELLYVGDETRDILAARKAGIDSVAVSWGLNAPDFLITAHPTYYVKQPEEIMAIPGLISSH